MFLFFSENHRFLSLLTVSFDPSHNKRCQITSQSQVKSLDNGLKLNSVFLSFSGKTNENEVKNF